MRNEENPYASPSADAAPQGVRQAALERLRPPAIGLLVTAILMLAMFALSLIANLIMYALDNPEFVDSQLRLWTAYWYVYVLLMVSNAVVIYGAIQMLRGRQYPACIIGALLGVIPICSPCYVLGIPFAIWAMVLLSRQDTRAAFAEAE